MATESRKLFELIEKNWILLNEEVERIASEHGRSTPKIITISKTRTIEEIEIAYDIGITDFGENYAQELESKAIKLPSANWHFVGHLQRGNAKRITPHCSLLHTLDTIKLARKLSNLSFKGKSLIQIKMGSELSKSGIEGDFEEVKALLDEAKSLGLEVIGLMGMGSLSWNKDETIKQYSELNSLRDALGLSELSLGMSDDFVEAIISGSTMIRIGTKIFGPRK
ncbi:MAG: YggS family pyridoxal phosphate-dependent enzyme [Candidatus Kariarchaeaceae archaeon]|jgi:pyridoxal phosphate enzyme (YggS family)